MSMLWWVGGIGIALGVTTKNDFLGGVGGICIAIALSILLLKALKNGVVAGTQLAVGKVKERAAEKREEREHQTQLRRELERIETIEKARASQQLDLYRQQVAILAEYKKKEGDITAELLAMRQKLLALESQENEAMVKKLIQTLDSI